MSDQVRNYRRELANVMNEMADSVIEMPDDEVRAALSENGEAIPSVKSILRKATISYKQRHLIAAKKCHEEKAAAFKQKFFSIPDAVKEQREMLTALIANNLIARTALTVQFRDFEDIVDDDLPGILKQLIELGVFKANAEEDNQ